MTDRVLSFEIAEKLKKLGVEIPKDEIVGYWAELCHEEGKDVIIKYVLKDNIGEFQEALTNRFSKCYCRAEVIPTTDCLGAFRMLPIKTNLIKKHYGKEPWQSDIYYSCWVPKYDIIISGKSPIDALGLMLVKLGEEGILNNV